MRFSLGAEVRLIAAFASTSAVKECLKEFCQDYRVLGLGPSFLNEAHSTRWLVSWRDQGASPGRSLETLGIVKGWTHALFAERTLDHDAFHYLDCAGFLTGQSSAIHLEPNLQSYIRAYAFELKGHQDSSVRIYRKILDDFNCFQATWDGHQPGWSALESEELLTGWVQSQCRRVDDRNAGSRLGTLRNFLEFMRAQNRLSSNPADALLARYPRRGFRGLAQALGSTMSGEALEELRATPRFFGPWGSRMVEFIELKRSLGAGYDFEERTLAQLDRFLAQHRLEAGATIPPPVIREWLDSLPEINARTRHTKRRVAELFFDHATRRGFISENPARSLAKVARQRTRPFVFDVEQIREIQREASELTDIPFFVHRGATYAAIFATLYCLGLRVGEACRLSRDDVDLGQGLVLIRRSKFYKSRLLPLGPRYRSYLAGFLSLRAGVTDKVDAPLFPSRYGHRICRQAVGEVFRRIVTKIRLPLQPGHRNACLHSFRHSFALHRLIRWYREGADVQAKLPLLSSFMGHVDIASTQVYLQATPELLDVANERFEARFGRPAGLESGVAR